MFNDEIVNEADGEARRKLIKAAVAAGVGVAAYGAPKISSIPAYAQGQSLNLGSIDDKTGVQSIWFSPDMNDGCGTWETSTCSNDWDNAGYGGTSAVPSIELDFTVAGQSTSVKFDGNPNGGLDESTCSNFEIEFTAPAGKCELEFYGVGCNKCDGGIGADSKAGTDATQLTGVYAPGTIQYCTDTYGAICGTKNMNNKCLTAFFFEVKCII